MRPKANPPGRRPVKGKGLAGSRRVSVADGPMMESPTAGDNQADGRASDRPRPRGTAKERGLRLLGVRWRSREELRRRLRQAGFDAGEIEQALGDLERAGLVDDAQFSAELVRDRAGRRLDGRRAIRESLRQKGVPEDVALAALGELEGEAERALELATRRAARLASVQPEAAYRRLYGMLLRRGYDGTVAREACRRALAEAFPRAELDPEP